MTKLTVWDPFRDLGDLHDEINKLFWGMGKRRERGDMAVSSWIPNVDISEDPEAVKISVELAGMKREDVKLSIENGVMTIRGERKFEDEKKKKDYHRIERSYGMFERSFTIPSTVEPDKVDASMKDGVLEIIIPKKETIKPKEIEIKAK